MLQFIVCYYHKFASYFGSLLEFRDKNHPQCEPRPEKEPCFPSGEELYPLKRYSFHDLLLPGPNDAKVPGKVRGNLWCLYGLAGDCG